MKKTFLCALCVVLVLVFAFAGCGKADSSGQGAGGGEGVDLESLKTLGDAFAIESDNSQFAFSETQYVYVFEAEGTAYRVYADMPEDVSKEANAQDVMDEDYDQKVKDIVAPLEITSKENLSEQIIPQEELDKLVGKTGEELVNDGWTITGWNVDVMEFYMEKDAFEYTVVFDGTLEYTDDFDGEQEVKPLTVKSVTYNGLGGGATNLE